MRFMEKLKRLRKLAEKYKTSIEDLPKVLKKMKDEIDSIEKKKKLMGWD